MNEQRKWCFEIESTTDVSAVKIVEMTAKYLEYYVSLIDKEAARFEVLL